MGFADGAANARDRLGLWGFGGGGHGWIPVKNAPTTVAAEHFAFAQLVPHLRANAHAAAGALLVVDAGNAGAARAGEPVVANEPVGANERTEGLTFGIQGGEFGGVFLLAFCCADARFVECAGEGFHLRARFGESSFRSFGTLKAREFFVFEAIGFRGFESDFMLDCRSLLGSLDDVKLGAEANSLLAVRGDLAIETGAERFFSCEGRREFG